MDSLLTDTPAGYDFSINDNQRMIGQMAKDFAEKHIRPYVMEWDEAQHFPLDLFKKLGELGMMGVFVPHEYGGSGFGYFEYVTVIVEIAKVCGSIGLSVAAHNSLCTGHILAFGMLKLDVLELELLHDLRGKSDGKGTPGLNELSFHDVCILYIHDRRGWLADGSIIKRP